jgi:hypothetical protein
VSLLNRTSRILSFSDLQVNSNPKRRGVDWTRDLLGIPVEKDQQQKYTIDPMSEIVIFNGTRSLTLDNTTELALTSVAVLDPTRYRLAWTGTGTAPGFRTDRGLTLSGGTLTIALQTNSTILVTHSGVSVFGSVQVGDVVFIPGASTGDTAHFSPLNEGEWFVLAASATSLTLARSPDEVFQGASESTAVSADSQVQAYTPTGVQVNDTLDITGGFAASARRSFVVVAVTSSRVDFISVTPLAAQTLAPGAASVTVYSSAKRYVAIESDESVALKFNGSTDEGCRVEPILAGDPDLVGVFEKWGTAFSLSIKNRSTAIAEVLVISAE